MESYYIKNILENNINKEKLYENITFQQVDIVHLSYQHYYVLCIIPMWRFPITKVVNVICIFFYMTFSQVDMVKSYFDKLCLSF
jgi:hypothetical protein